MKKIFAIFSSIVLSILLASCSDPSLVGKWHVQSVSGEELTEEEQKATIEFDENGTFTQIHGEHVKKGTWAASEDGKTVTIIPDGDDPQEMKGLNYEGETVSFKDGNDEVVLERLKN